MASGVYFTTWRKGALQWDWEWQLVHTHDTLPLGEDDGFANEL